MSELSREDTLLLALITSGHTAAQDYALSIITSVAPEVAASVAVATPAPVNTPATTVTTTPPADTGPVIDATDLDKRGFPWCSEIHAKTKTKDAKGNWKYAVGIDRDNLVPAVEAKLREQGYGQPQAETPAPTPAPTPAATPGLPPVAGATGLPPVAAGGLPPAPPAAPVVKTEFPAAGSEEDMDENALVQTAAALADKHGNEVLRGLLTLFQVPDGGSVKDVPAGYRFTFYQYATSDDALSQQSLI